MDLNQILYGVYIVIALAVLTQYRFILKMLGIIIIPETSIGVITKNFVLFGSNTTLPENRVVALKGEAGIQAETLAPGIYFWYWPWQYDVG